jgi:hypothetical protein
MDHEHATRMIAELEEYFGEPVQPVSEYCSALQTWKKCLDRLDGSERHRHLSQAAQAVRLAISKSNLLYRLIYQKQKLRSIPCPIHLGRWSGYVECSAGCNDGLDATGWLPEAELATLPLPRSSEASSVVDSERFVCEQNE